MFTVRRFVCYIPRENVRINRLYLTLKTQHGTLDYIADDDVKRFRQLHT